MTINEMFIDLQTTTKATWESVRDAGERIEALTSDDAFITAGDDDPYCILWLHTNRKYYFGYLPRTADQIDVEQFKKLTVTATRDITRVTCNNLWVKPQTKEAA